MRVAGFVTGPVSQPKVSDGGGGGEWRVNGGGLILDTLVSGGGGGGGGEWMDRGGVDDADADAADAADDAPRPLPWR